MKIKFHDKWTLELLEELFKFGELKQEHNEIREKGEVDIYAMQFSFEDKEDGIEKDDDIFSTHSSFEDKTDDVENMKEMVMNMTKLKYKKIAEFVNLENFDEIIVPILFNDDCWISDAAYDYTYKDLSFEQMKKFTFVNINTSVQRYRRIGGEVDFLYLVSEKTYKTLKKDEDKYTNGFKDIDRLNIHIIPTKHVIDDQIATVFLPVSTKQNKVNMWFTYPFVYIEDTESLYIPIYGIDNYSPEKLTLISNKAQEE